jgi:hypothetical protein
VRRSGAPRAIRGGRMIRLTDEQMHEIRQAAATVPY